MWLTVHFAYCCVDWVSVLNIYIFIATALDEAVIIMLHFLIKNIDLMWYKLRLMNDVNINQ